MEKSITPKSDYLMQEVQKTLLQYTEGAITSPEGCIHILVMIADYEKQICDENDAMKKLYGE
jgi:hypothetical protein